MLLAAPAFAEDEPAVPARNEGGGDPAPAADDPAPPPREELERRGATIRAITIIVDNVFDPSKPDENKRLYRWANHVHIRTHESVIGDMLLFDVGRRIQRPVARRIGARSSRPRLSRRRVARAARYDAATNSVEVDVRVRDSWSLAPDLKFSRSGGENRVRYRGLRQNLFGTGKGLTVSYSSNVDRDETLLGYNDANVFGTRVRLNTVLANATDGHRRSSCERPFFSLDTRWSIGGGYTTASASTPMYDLGEEIDEFRHDHALAHVSRAACRTASSIGARAAGCSAYAEEDSSSDARQAAAPAAAGDRKLVYPWIGWQFVEDDYREMTELNDMGRTEDIVARLEPASLSLGFAKKSFGSDRDATLLRANGAEGWEPGGPGAPAAVRRRRLDAPRATTA